MVIRDLKSVQKGLKKGIDLHLKHKCFFAESFKSEEISKYIRIKVRNLRYKINNPSNNDTIL